MSSRVKSSPRLSDDELLLNDRLLIDGRYGQKRAKPALSIFGKKMRRRKQWYVVYPHVLSTSEEFKEDRRFTTSAIYLPASTESLRKLQRQFGILNDEGHHFGDLEIRGCKENDIGDVIVFSMDVHPDEPDLELI